MDVDVRYVNVDVAVVGVAVANVNGGRTKGLRSRTLLYTISKWSNMACDD